MDIGIDLGTSFCVLAVPGRVRLADGYPQGRYLEECDVTVVPTPQGQAAFASALWSPPEEPDRTIAGAEAVRMAEEGAAPILFSKREIGATNPLPLHDRGLTPRQVACQLLKHLRACAEQALEQPVLRAVVTHPACFSRPQIEQTRQAAVDAGIDMALAEQMLPDPVAAALAYTRADRRDPLRVLIFDLGGGTCDAAVVERRGSILAVRAFDGCRLLGGYTLDRELLHWLRRCLEAKGHRLAFDEGEPAARRRFARLLALAEAAKLRLAEADDGAQVEFRAAGLLANAGGEPSPVLEPITRQRFVHLIQPHLDAMAQCCRRALQKAKLEPHQLDEVLLVGGSSRGPWVEHAIAEAFP